MSDAHNHAVQAHPPLPVGLTRIEVQARPEDVGLIQAVASLLQDDPDASAALRSLLQEQKVSAVAGPTLMDLLRCDLPDKAFEPMLARDGSTGRDMDL